MCNTTKVYIHTYTPKYLMIYYVSKKKSRKKNGHTLFRSLRSPSFLRHDRHVASNGFPAVLSLWSLKSRAVAVRVMAPSTFDSAGWLEGLREPLSRSQGRRCWLPPASRLRVHVINKWRLQVAGKHSKLFRMKAKYEWSTPSISIPFILFSPVVHRSDNFINLDLSTEKNMHLLPSWKNNKNKNTTPFFLRAIHIWKLWSLLYFSLN